MNFYFFLMFLQAYGPIPDLTVNNISLKSLIYGVTLEASGQSWQIIICINCKSVLFAKRLASGPGSGAGATMPIYYLNSDLLCSNEELAQRRAHKSYSETFELLMMDNDDSNPGASAVTPPATGVVNSASSLSIGSLSTHAPIDARQQRLRQIQAHQQQRVQAEITETNKAIERFTEQKFELLKIFREKSNQEAAILADLILQIPDTATELLDGAMPVALEVTGGVINYAGAGPTARRRNTISSRRELSIPTTPTTPLVQPPSFLTTVQQESQPSARLSRILSSIQQDVQPQTPQLPSASILTTRKMSNFDTPPATPEATPMSVSNSPTFRQQQQQHQAVTAARGAASNTSPTVATVGADDADDCLFALDDVDGPGSQPVQVMQNARIYHQQQQQHFRTLQQQQQHQLLLQQQQQQDNMSDADEAEGKKQPLIKANRYSLMPISSLPTDALDLDSSLSIPMRARDTPALNPFANFARSLPVEIANSPLAERAAAAAANHNNMNNNRNNNVVLEDVEVSAGTGLTSRKSD